MCPLCLLKNPLCLVLSRSNSNPNSSKTSNFKCLCQKGAGGHFWVIHAAGGFGEGCRGVGHGNSI